MISDERVEAGLAHYAEGGCSGLDDNERREVVRSILEAALTASEGGWRVKPLQWEPGVVDWARPMPGMKYVACSSEGNQWAWWLEGDEPATRERCDNEQAAKAAAQSDYEARIRSALEPVKGERVRHKKRGTTYEVVGTGKMQAEDWNDMARDADNCACGPSVDMREVTIYRSESDGSLWVRPVEEFNDGRFEAKETPND